MTSKGSRKRVKPSPGGVDTPVTPDGRERSDSQTRGRNAPSKQNWYPGVWSSAARVPKAAPVTEVARESISAAKSVASTAMNTSASLLETPIRTRNPSLQLTRKEGASARSLPVGATTTRVNIASDGSASTIATGDNSDSATIKAVTSDKETSEDTNTKPVEKTAKEQATAPNTDSSQKLTDSAEGAEQPSGWFSWLYGTPNTTQATANAPESTETTERPPAEQSTEQVAQSHVKELTREVEATPAAEASQDTIEVRPTAHKRSWLQMWYGTNTPNNQEEPSSAAPTAVPPVAENITEESNSEMPPKDPTKDPREPNGGSQTPVTNARSSGWSFWSKDTNKDAPSDAPQTGEAVEASVEQDKSLKTNASDPDADGNVKITHTGSIKVKPPKDSHLKDGSVSTVDAPPAEPRPADITASKQLQKILPNQVLPSFQETYSFEESPSILQSLGRLLHYSKGEEIGHVSKVREPLRVKRALAIGVHGYFPAPLIRSVLGQPTGTSIRFSNMAADAIRKYTESHGYTCDIEKIALEGEGRIAERVDLLWKLLLNWMEEIRKADFVMIACHSQGVPVGVMLVAKLIQFGCLDAKRVGICAMAGVNLGPFPTYRSRFINGSAGELFEFALPFSKVSKEYESALRCTLDFGVRISYIGSIDDQLVSLESSLFSPVAHPYVYRAVFVDGRVHAPSFLSHLVGFALKLRNLGISDHGLIRELSAPLAGSLYSGEGHSRLYEDEAVYSMAIEFALETSSIPNSTLSIKRATSSVSPNPYILPFAMRGLLEEEYVRREMHGDTMELLKQFDDWKPSSKVLKDVKFRLEGIRSKL
ncbi:unnamed protein product [Penicillium salamii]|uniref:YMC020W-like alpha/beta hydrolase domain-containing protein n=1 Tax=Penicillium salamii TaxID=1612424 RepID=A0A9W4IGU4_9EURO|nr:unnamed protein product [Penicillium salamii]CAG8252175.1 unnamed protein product [Penicillium salamii]CAG8275953.1 unnamed protein product [Penicillium salamii]CAG8294531.1 unnamed protein product [Penicillium salamii]CAG8389227.1 unnamed protein product [Penicillium salamii]